MRPDQHHFAPDGSHPVDIDGLQPFGRQPLDFLGIVDHCAEGVEPPVLVKVAFSLPHGAYHSVAEA